MIESRVFELVKQGVQAIVLNKWSGVVEVQHYIFKYKLKLMRGM